MDDFGIIRGEGRQRFGPRAEVFRAILEIHFRKGRKKGAYFESHPKIIKKANKMPVFLAFYLFMTAGINMLTTDAPTQVSLPLAA